VNAGAVAVRVVAAGPDVPPCSLAAGVVLVGVVDGVVVVLVRGVVVGVVVVASGSGALATLTVFVPPPQPASSTVARVAPRKSMGILVRGLIAWMVFAVRGTPPRFSPWRALCRPAAALRSTERS
jgi:hypothetical protein